MATLYERQVAIDEAAPSLNESLAGTHGCSNQAGGGGRSALALRRMAAALRRVGRGSDRAYRLGGDEFVLLLPGGAVTDAADLTNRLARSGAPSFSLGIADSAADPADRLLTVADQRMYASRSDGRHRRPSRSATPSKT